MNRLDRWWVERSDARRIDRGPMYVSMLLALVFSSLSLVLWGPVPGSNISTLSNATQMLLASILLLGSSTAFFGSITGSRFFFRKWSRRQSYRAGIAGLPAIMTSMAFYTYAIYDGAKNVASGLGGTLAPLLCVGVAINGVYLTLEIRRIDRNIAVVMEAETEIENDVDQ